ncbi:aminoacyl-tRNA hydrolase [Methylobrevis pamukkalensis]|uniref:Peptidyl-tRNA hydrolase n=1 Tax=Methylobrevis pamukkalensis TaxID=1439726 RepID=A0A1E3H7M0_9HYPH|nr:aminoacyl-tRNA hydrolase [Methylobrevis pamukkalensis]ODN71501.1 Peptidyl-tRNA hydrolase [Methylobrevis pamukkalensis]
MLLIAGLGNPGARYAGNRHNIGFMAVDRIHDLYRFGPWRSKFQAEIAEGTIDGQKVLLMKPLTFMNESGRAVGEAARFHKIAPGQIVVIHDELDLPAAKMRVKTGGGHGGHNGLRSLDAHLGKDYRRIRLGIGHPGDKDQVHNHVLGDFHKVDREWIDPLLDALAAQAPLLVAGEDETFASKVHLATAPDKPARKPKPAAPPAPAAPADIAAPTRAADTPKSALAEGLAKLLRRD